MHCGAQRIHDQLEDECGGGGGGGAARGGAGSDHTGSSRYFSRDSIHAADATARSKITRTQEAEESGSICLIGGR
jgi:hypothetical protein